MFLIFEMLLRFYVMRNVFLSRILIASLEGVRSE